jgi:hypothetical protein
VRISGTRLGILVSDTWLPFSLKNLSHAIDLVIFNGKVLNLVHQLHLPKNPSRQDDKNNKR